MSRGRSVKNVLILLFRHFIIVQSGQEDFFEGDLILEKFLCGLSLSATILAESLLSEEIKSEADSMLKHLISHWPELKNTLPDGLRDLFIKRDGKLIQKDKGYKIDC